MAKRPSISETPENRQPAPEETWNTEWGIQRRLLEARKILRTRALSETFKIQRDFEAFSIHTLADECERVLNDLGVVSDFTSTKWFKNGNSTIIEGLLTFRCVDQDGETHEVACVGEGIDGSDKGFGKAVSYARKNGYIAALQLAVGANNEASDPKAEPGAPIQSAPLQTQQPPQPQQVYQGQPFQPPQRAALGPTYTLNLIGCDQVISKLDVVNLCTQAFASCPTAQAVDDLLVRNQVELHRLWQEDKAVGYQVSEAAGVRKGNILAAAQSKVAA